MNFLLPQILHTRMWYYPDHGNLIQTQYCVGADGIRSTSIFSFSNVFVTRKEGSEVEFEPVEAKPFLGSSSAENRILPLSASTISALSEYRIKSLVGTRLPSHLTSSYTVSVGEISGSIYRILSEIAKARTLIRTAQLFEKGLTIRR